MRKAGEAIRRPRYEVALAALERMKTDEIREVYLDGIRKAGWAVVVTPSPKPIEPDPV